LAEWVAVLPRISAAAPPRREGPQNIPRRLRREKRGRVLRSGNRRVLRSSACAPETRPRTLPCPQRLLPPGSGRASEPHLPRKRVSSSRAVLRPSTHRM
jgi:hypothetical protein